MTMTMITMTEDEYDAMMKFDADDKHDDVHDEDADAEDDHHEDDGEDDQLTLGRADNIIEHGVGCKSTNRC